MLLSYAATHSIDILEMEVMPDHVAILTKVDQQIGFDNAVKSIKGYTSRVLKNEFPFLKTKKHHKDRRLNWDNVKRDQI